MYVAPIFRESAEDGQLQKSGFFCGRPCNQSPTISGLLLGPPEVCKLPDLGALLLAQTYGEELHGLPGSRHTLTSQVNEMPLTLGNNPYESVQKSGDLIWYI